MTDLDDRLRSHFDPDRRAELPSGQLRAPDRTAGAAGKAASVRSSPSLRRWPSSSASRPSS